MMNKISKSRINANKLNMEQEVHQDGVNEADLSGLGNILEANINLMVPIGKT